jgi:hypothetical protein
MEDVVAVALVSSGASLLGAAVGALTTYKVSLRNAETSVATADAQKEVELAKIKAENERLHEQHGEEKRRNRQATYHRTLTVLQRIYGLQPDAAELSEVQAEWRECRSGVNIFGSRAVSAAIEEVQKVVIKFPGGEDRPKWEDELAKATSKFVADVRADIGTHDA